jgi:site-specific recombinase XerD
MRTISTYFYLRSPESKKDSTIMVMLSANKERIRFSTGISTPVKDWNKKKRKSNTTSINKQLRAIDVKVEEYRNDCELRERDLDLAELADIIRGDEKKTLKQKVFIDYIQMYYDAHKRIKANNTIRKYITLKNFFISHYPDKKLHEVDSKFAVDLKKYCLSVKETDNTISKRFQLIRVVLKWCIEMKYIQSFDLKYFTHNQTEKSESVYLTPFELEKIAALELSGSKNIEFTRDIFLVSCFTGVDFCDLKQLTKQNLHKTEKGNRYFQIVRKKTEKGNIASFPPCNDEIIRILSKWDWDIEGNLKSCDKSRYHIQKVARLAGIDELVKLSKKSGNEVIIKQRPKYEFIHWKTGRRTFITIKLSEGKLTEFVSNAVGHVKTGTTKLYQHLKPSQMVDALVGN